MKLKTKFMALMLLMAVVGQSAWANITYNYDSSTSTLTFDSTTGNEDLTSVNVKDSQGYYRGVQHIVIGGGIKGIADDAFDVGPEHNTKVWHVESIEFAETSYNTKLYVSRGAFNWFEADNFICNRDFEFENPNGSGSASTLNFGVFCNSPKKVTIKSKVTNIPPGAFIRGMVGEIDLSKAANLETIGGYAFAYAKTDKFQNLRIPANVTSVRKGAFVGFSCEKILIEYGSTSIGLNDEAFFDGVKSFECYRQITGKTPFESNGEIGNVKLQSVTLGANFVLGTNEGNSSFFKKCLALKSLTLLSNDIFTDNYTTSNNLATEFKYIETLTLGANVTKVGANAFNGSDKLKTLNVQGSSTLNLGANAFANCPNLKTVNGVENGSANWLAIYKQIGVNFKEFKFGSWIRGAKEWSDDDNLYTMFPNLEKITFGAWLYTIDNDLYNCPYNTSKLKEIVFEEPAGVNVGTYAFVNHTNLTKITGKMLKINNWAFYRCEKLTEVDFTGCKSIGLMAFNTCNALRKIVLPASVESIGTLCFGNNPLLKNAEIYSQALMNDASLADKLGEFIENLTIHTPTIGIAFQNADKLKNVLIGEEVTDILSNAFSNATNLKNVVFESGYLLNKDWAEKDNLATRFPYVENVSLPDYTQIKDYAFSSSKTLKKVNGKIDPTYGDFCFADCANLEDVMISCEDLGAVAQGAFLACKKLTNVKIESAFGIEQFAFYQAGVKELDLPANCELILEKAFSGCPLTHVISRNPDVVSCDRDVFDADIIKQNKATLDVPVESIEDYKNGVAWNLFYDIFAIGGVKLIDGEPYTNDVDQEVAAVRYTRNFSASSVNKWQALCIPFSIDVVGDGYEIGKILTFCPMKDTNGDGTIDGNDDNYLVISPCKSGKTVANVPYMIKPKKSGNIVFTEENCTLYAADAGELHFSTTETSYNVYGILQKPIVATIENDYYYMSAAGNLSHKPKAGSTNVKPNRWYMTMVNKTYGGTEVDNISNARDVQIFTIGEDMDEATAIGIIETGAGNNLGKASNGSIYTLSGMKIDNANNLPAGIYVKNGKKFVVK